VDAIELPANHYDDLHDRPGIYRRNQEIFKSLTERQWREALACYYASGTSEDTLPGVDNVLQ